MADRKKRREEQNEIKIKIRREERIKSKQKEDEWNQEVFLTQLGWLWTQIWRDASDFANLLFNWDWANQMKRINLKENVWTKKPIWQKVSASSDDWGFQWTPTGTSGSSIFYLSPFFSFPASLPMLLDNQGAELNKGRKWLQWWRSEQYWNSLVELR